MIEVYFLIYIINIICMFLIKATLIRKFSNKEAFKQ